MAFIHLYNKIHKSVAQGGWDLLDTWESDPNTLIWVNISGEVTEKDAEILLQRLNIHPLGLQDAKQNRHPPKLEAFDDHTLIIHKGMPSGMESLGSKSIQIATFVGQRFVITRHSEESPEVETFAQELQKNTVLFEQGTGAMATRLSRLIVNRYLKVLMQLEPQLEELETNLMSDTGEKILSELITLKSHLTFLDRIFFYHVDIAKGLSKKVFPGFNVEDCHRVIDICEQQERGASLTAMYYRLASDLIEGYISVSSHRLNQIMKILTIVTAIFVPLGFLAGIYGMNFEYIPELKSHWGYFYLIGTMATIATVLIVIFRRKKWL